METDLSISSKQFKAFYDPVHDPVFLFDPAEKALVAANAAFTNLWPAASTLPQPAKDFLPEEVLLLLPYQKKMQIAWPLFGAAGQVAILQTVPVLLEGMPLLLCITTQELLKINPGEKPIEKDILQGSFLQKAALQRAALPGPTLREVYHRTKNNLNIVVSLVGLQLNREQDGRVRLLLQESKSRIYALALLQEQLYQSEHLAEIKANEYLQALVKSVIATFAPSGQTIKLLAGPEDCWLPVDTAVPLGLLVNELVSHMVQQAFDSDQACEIGLDLKCSPSGEWRLKLVNNGRLMAHEQDLLPQASLNKQLIKGLAKQLKATITTAVEESGSSVCIFTSNTV